VIPLQWTDFDFKVTKKVFIQRAYTHGELGAPKSTASAAELPLPEDLIEIIQAYRPSVRNSIWLFPSPVTGGPRSADMILADHLKPAAKKLGLPKPGWHTSFRHGYRSWLGAGTATTSVKGGVKVGQCSGAKVGQWMEMKLLSISWGRASGA
jgi:integrase